MGGVVTYETVFLDFSDIVKLSIEGIEFSNLIQNQNSEEIKIDVSQLSKGNYIFENNC